MGAPLLWGSKGRVVVESIEHGLVHRQQFLAFANSSWGGDKNCCSLVVKPGIPAKCRMGKTVDSVCLKFRKMDKKNPTH